MIKLLQNQTNNITVTLYENTTIVSPVYYLFQFINDDTNESVYCTATDISPNTVRYNNFDITLVDANSSPAPEPTLGIITLKPSGSWKYNVYQQASETNIDPLLTGDLVETGRVSVIGDVVPEKVTYTSEENKTNTVYYNN